METEVKVALIGVLSALIPALIAIIGICLQKKCKESKPETVTKPDTVIKPEKIIKPEPDIVIKPKLEKIIKPKLAIVIEPKIEPKPEKIIKPKPIITEWISCSRFDDIPKNSIYVGDTKEDGQVYIGRFNNTPGKVNIDKGKIWNFWVQGEGHSVHGDILTTNGKYEWKYINRGQLIPDNIVPHSIDNNKDKVWVGKNTRGEPGKINCQDNYSQNPTMHNIWCHHDGDSKNAYILTIS